MVAFIELPCNLHVAPLGLPARAPPVLGGVHRSAFFDWAQWGRHDVARRVDCAFLAELVATHQLEEDEARDWAHALSQGLAKSAYGF